MDDIFDEDQYNDLRDYINDETWKVEKLLEEELNTSSLKNKIKADLFNLRHGRNVGAVDEKIYENKKKMEEKLAKIMHERTRFSQDDSIMDSFRAYRRRRAEIEQRLPQPIQQQNQPEIQPPQIHLPEPFINPIIQSTPQEEHLPQPFVPAQPGIPVESRMKQALSFIQQQQERDYERAEEERKRQFERQTGFRLRSIFDQPVQAIQVEEDDDKSHTSLKKRKRSFDNEDDEIMVIPPEDHPISIYSEIPFTKETKKKVTPKKTPTKEDKPFLKKVILESQNLKNPVEFPEIILNAEKDVSKKRKRSSKKSSNFMEEEEEQAFLDIPMNKDDDDLLSENEDDEEEETDSQYHGPEMVYGPNAFPYNVDSYTIQEGIQNFRPIELHSEKKKVTIHSDAVTLYNIIIQDSNEKIGQFFQEAAPETVYQKSENKLSLNELSSKRRNWHIVTPFDAMIDVCTRKTLTNNTLDSDPLSLFMLTKKELTKLGINPELREMFGNEKLPASAKKREKMKLKKKEKKQISDADYNESPLQIQLLKDKVTELTYQLTVQLIHPDFYNILGSFHKIFTEIFSLENSTEFDPVLPYLHYLGQYLSGNDSASDHLFRNINYIINEIFATSNDDKFLSYLMTTLNKNENSADTRHPKDFFIFCLSFFTKSFLSEVGGHFGALYFYSDNPLHNFSNLINNNIPDLHTEDLILGVSNKCLYEGRNADIILFCWSIAIIMIGEMKFNLLDNSYKTSDTISQIVNFSTSSNNYKILKDFMSQSFPYIFNAVILGYDKVVKKCMFSIFTGEPSNIKRDQILADSFGTVYDRVKRGNLMVSDSVPPTHLITTEEKMSNNTIIVPRMLNNDGTYFSTKRAFRNNPNDQLKSFQSDSYLVHESEAFGIVVRSPAVPIEFSQWFRNSNFVLARNFDKLILTKSFLKTFIYRICKSLCEKYTILSVSFTGLFSMLLRHEGFGEQFRGFNYLSGSGAIELFGRGVWWALPAYDFKEGQIHFLEQLNNTLSAKIDHAFEFLFEFMQLTSRELGSQRVLGERFDDKFNEEDEEEFLEGGRDENDRNLNAVYRDGQVVIEPNFKKKGVYSGNLKDLFRRYTVLPDSYQGSNLKIKLLGSLLKNVEDDHYWSKDYEVKNSLVEKLEYVGSDSFIDFVFHVNRMFSILTDRNSLLMKRFDEIRQENIDPDTQAPLDEEKLMFKFNKFIDSLKMNFSDIPYYMIGVNVTILPQISFAKLLNLKHQTQQASMPSFFAKDFPLFYRKAYYRIRLETADNSPVTPDTKARWNRSITYRTILRADQITQDNPNYRAYVRKRTIRQAKLEVINEERNEIIALLSNANIYSVNTRYIKSMDWIDFSNSRISNMDGYYIDTEFFNTVDIPCHYKSAWFTLMFFTHKVTTVVDLYAKLWDLLVTDNSRRGQYNFYSRDNYFIDTDLRKHIEATTMVLTTISQRKALIDAFYDDLEKFGHNLVLRRENNIQSSIFLDHHYNRDAYFLRNRENNEQTENRLINLEMMLQYTYKQSLALFTNPEENQHILSNDLAISLSDFHDSKSKNMLFFLNWFNHWFDVSLHHKFVMMIHEVNKVISIETEGDESRYVISSFEEFMEKHFGQIIDENPKKNIEPEDPWFCDKTFFDKRSELSIHEYYQKSISYKWFSFCYSVRSNHISYVNFADFILEFKRQRSLKIYKENIIKDSYCINVPGFSIEKLEGTTFPKLLNDYKQISRKVQESLTSPIRFIKTSEVSRFLLIDNQRARSIETVGLRKLQGAKNNVLIFWDLETYNCPIDNMKQIPFLLSMKIYAGQFFDFYFTDIIEFDMDGKKNKVYQLLKDALIFEHTFGGESCCYDFVSFLYYTFLQKSSGNYGTINIYSFNGAKFDHIFLVQLLIQYGITINGSGINDPKSMMCGQYKSAQYRVNKPKYTQNSLCFIDFMLIHPCGGLKVQAKIFLAGEENLQKLDFDVAGKTKEEYINDMNNALTYVGRDVEALAGLYVMYRYSVNVTVRDLHRQMFEKIENTISDADKNLTMEQLLRLTCKLKSFSLIGDASQYAPHYVSSSAGLAIKIYKECFHNPLIDLRGDKKNVLEILRMTFFGGYTSNFCMYKDCTDIDRKLNYYDINSSYPYVMTKEMPIYDFDGVNPQDWEEGFIMRQDLKSFWTDRNKYCRFIQKFSLYFCSIITFTENEQSIYPFPVRGSMKYTSRVGSFYPRSLTNRWVWGYELTRYANIFNKYHPGRVCPFENLEITSYLPYRMTYHPLFDSDDDIKYQKGKASIFKGYIQYFYEKKQRGGLPNATDEEKACKPLYKLLLNSLYGKFSQRHFNKSYYGYNFDLHKAVNPDKVINIHDYGFREERGVIKKMEVENDERGIGDLVRISSWITAVARLRLWKMMFYLMYSGTTDNIKDRMIYYADTDSIITTGTFPSRYCDKNAIGKWDLEKRVLYGYFVLPKFYSLVDEKAKIDIKSKGIRKNIMNYDSWFKLLEHKEFHAFQTQFSRHLGSVYVNPEFKKDIHIKIQKRKFTNNEMENTDPSLSFENENEYNEFLKVYY